MSGKLLSLSLPPSFSPPLSLSARTVSAQDAARTLRLVSLRGAGERSGGGGGWSTAGRVEVDVEKLFLFLPTIPTESFPKPAPLPVRGEIIDFFLSLFFLTPERGRSHVSQLYFNGTALNALLSRQPR